MKRNKKWNLSRRQLLSNVVHDCMKELFQKAQPSVNIDDYLKQIKEGKITDNTRPYIYQRHYISDAEAKYVVEKYLDAYRMKNEWRSNIDLLIKDLKEGCTVDKYIDEYVDEYGNEHPGHRSYDKREPLEVRISNILANAGVTNDTLAKELSDEVFDYIENRKDFYRFDREEDQFNWSIFLGACPTGNKQEVIDYWKSQGKDINIVERDPRTFWMIDNGYTDREIQEELEEMEKYDKEHKDEKDS